MFNERKVAQMAAYLLAIRETTMPHLKLIKLLYLSDRRSMDLYGYPMSGDRAVALPRGPVLSLTLNLINGSILSCQGGWESWISDKSDHRVTLKHLPQPEQLDELSAADRETLNSVWGEFGHMNQWQISDYTHDHCPEWRDPNGSMLPISFEEIFRALGKPAEVASELSARIEAQRSLDRTLAAL